MVVVVATGRIRAERIFVRLVFVWGERRARSQRLLVGADCGAREPEDGSRHEQRAERANKASNVSKARTGARGWKVDAVVGESTLHAVVGE